MGPRRGLVRNTYKTVRKLISKRKRPSKSAKRSKRSTKRSKRAKRSRTRGGGDGILGKVISFNINHKRGVTYERKERFDADITTGAGTVLSSTGAQGVFARTFLNGTLAGSGTDVQGIWNSRGISATNSRRKIRDTNVDIQCVSASTGIQEVTVYLLRANRDTGAGTNTTTSPTGAWSECAINLPNVQAPTIVGETPYISGFGGYWKICKKAKLVLNPGQCFRIKIRSNEHWAPSYSDIGQAIESSTSYTNIRGRTYGFMLVNKGMPVADATTNTVINYGSAKLNFTWRYTARSSTLIHALESKAFLANTLDPPGTILTAMEINDDDGTRVTHATA